MKLVLLAIFALVAMLIVSMVAEGTAQDAEGSARERAARESFWDVSEGKVVTVKGHEYIIVNGSNRGGIVHSESCPCKNGGAR